MSHTVVTEHMADYLEGDLALDLRALVDAHLDGCEDCAREVREMQQTIRLLRALPEPEVPPMIAANVMRRIRAGEADPSFFERLERIFGGVLEPRFVLPAAAVAVAALVVVSVQGGGPLSRSLEAARETTTGGSLANAHPERSAPRASAAPPSESDTALAATDEAATDRTFGASAATEAGRASVADGAEADAAAWAAAEAGAGAPAAGEASIAMALPDQAGDRIESESASAARPRALAYEEMMPVSVHAEGTASAWAPGPGTAAAERLRASRSAGQNAGGFGDPALAQGFAAAGAASGGARSAMEDASGFGGVVPLTLARGAVQSSRQAPEERVAAAGEDARDRWLNRALEDPEAFARYIASQNLAEQELWVARLSERALARGLMGDLVEALRTVAGGEARWLADDFAAEARVQGAAEAIDSSAQPGEFGAEEIR